MREKLFSSIKPFLKTLFLLSLVLVMALGQPASALAARSGGRIGGGSFRMPSRTYAPPRSYAPPGGGGYYPGGGGFGFPFLFPFFGIGGGFGGLFTILIFIAIANFLVQSFRRATTSDSQIEGGYISNPKVSLTRLQVGLLASARELQTDLNRIAQKANTDSSEGLAQVLQETSLALLRHPEYWVYAGSAAQQTRLESAETQFNRMVLTERSKLAKETVSNVKGQKLGQADVPATLPPGEGEGSLVNSVNEAPGEYIVATLLVAAQGDLKLPEIRGTEEVRQALSLLGGVSSDRLLALEVLWEPQAAGDTLSTDELIAEYPDLKLI
ncbi:MAG: DUF1517 domain-containing protein [Scytolyngbya sp. HA4215-MV1]|jgi:uncharacterized membrane protein|nr:DUF1517 domain-containing protein [Scytolyngbya sp. HA4215-MV1]